MKRTIYIRVVQMLLMCIISSQISAQVGFPVRVPPTGSYGRPMWVQLPADYNPAKKYPILFFFHGAGESSGTVWTNPAYMNGDSLVKIYNTNNSPTYKREHGWDGKAVNPVDGLTYEFIIASPQRDSWSTFGTEFYSFLNYMVDNYSVDTTRIYLTGLSAGGETVTDYVGKVDDPIRPYLPAAVVPMSVAGNAPTQTMAQYTVSDSIHVWGFGGNSDGLGANTVAWVDMINNIKPGYARRTYYNGGHCCWGTYYAPTYTENVGGINMNVYSWMLQYKRAGGSGGGGTPVILPPTVNAGSDQTVTLPTDNVALSGTYNAASGESITSFLWTKVSGGSATITNPVSVSTTITDLVAGSYVFRLKVTQSDGQIATDDVNVGVVAAPIDDCGCDVTLGINPGDSVIYYTNPGNAVPAGGTLCLAARKYNTVTLLNLKGTALNPITIKNCGGQVVIAGDSYGGMLNIKNSEYFNMTGTGDENFQYGFYIHAPYPPAFTTRTGANAGSGTRFYSFDHFKIEGVAIGFYCKVYPGDFEPNSWYPNWNQGNVTFNDNLVRNINGEAFYIGHNDAVDSVWSVNGLGDTVRIGVEPPMFDTVRFYNNITDSTQWDGIQVSGARPMLCYDNQVSNFGLSNDDGQRQGIIMGARSWGRVYNNYVNSGMGIGIVASPYSGPSGQERSLFYNNVIIKAQEFGMYFSDNTMKDGNYTGANVDVYNNTIIQSGTKAGMNVIKVANNGGTMNSFNMKNNLIAGYTNTPIVINPIMNKDTSNNIVIADTLNVGFVGAGNYKIAPSSGIYNIAGANMSAYYTDDYEHINRGGVYGMGAYKTFSSGSALFVDAGSDQNTISSSITLAGTGSPQSGKTVTGYKWTKVSGGSATIINSTSASTEVENLSDGVYVFRLTVTQSDAATAYDDVKVTVATPEVLPIVIRQFLIIKGKIRLNEKK